MAKRGATSELNHNNWDEEEEPEEAGVFVQADKETLQHRVIKKAKRRGTGTEDGASKTAFSGFAGLTGGITKSNTFSGFQTTPAKSGFGTFLGSKLTSPSGESPGLTFGGSSLRAQSVNGSKDQTTSSSTPGGGVGKNAAGDWKDSPAYFSFLKALNLSVLAWIKQHVEENPYIILTPIFKDYEKYLKNQETEACAAMAEGLSSSAKKDADPVKDSDDATLPAQSDVNKESSSTDKEDAVPKSTPVFAASGSSTFKGFSFGATSGGTGSFSFGGISKPASTTTSKPASTSVETTTAATTAASVTSSSGFSFGMSSSGSSKPLFSFGTSSSTATTSGFSFGASSLKPASSVGESSNGATNDDDEYVPPKPEVREIKEDDALYTKRCKLYFQRNDQWVDKGIGNLHLKPVSENKTQILVRADTNLGNILLNVMLSASLPVSRQAKNNVLIVCVPNPPLDSKTPESDQNKPVPMLIRVKTEQDADELFGKIEERKKLL
ncbi:nuclear pore complex protein Nup50 [Elysia marginata]|uniref:Nuclear pore complex protein Nup50 n=1 Tax=Elysia marginata TaxID=1093978 RepID=A0AAV4I3N1_9GAST|nr:nuclear pore complex protein Nup50 [Elysia marginata]